MTAVALTPSRRSFLTGGASLAALTLAGCATQRLQVAPSGPPISEFYRSMYGALPDEPFPVPAIDLKKLDPNMFRTRSPIRPASARGRSWSTPQSATCTS